MKVDILERRFKWNTKELPDPDPELSPEEVLKFYSGTYPELATANVKGPEFKSTYALYEFSSSYKPKG